MLMWKTREREPLGSTLQSPSSWGAFQRRSADQRSSGKGFERSERSAGRSAGAGCYCSRAAAELERCESVRDCGFRKSLFTLRNRSFPSLLWWSLNRGGPVSRVAAAELWMSCRQEMAVWLSPERSGLPESGRDDTMASLITSRSEQFVHSVVNVQVKTWLRGHFHRKGDLWPSRLCLSNNCGEWTTHMTTQPGSRQYGQIC